MRLFVTILVFLLVPLLGSAQNQFSIVNKTDSSVTLHFTLSNYHFSSVQIDSIAYSVIVDNTSQSIAMQSYPELPKYTIALVVPENAQLRFTSIDSVYTEYTNLRIIPSTGSLKRQAELSDIKEGKQYSRNEYSEKIRSYQMDYLSRMLKLKLACYQIIIQLGYLVFHIT